MFASEGSEPSVAMMTMRKKTKSESGIRILRVSRAEAAIWAGRVMTNTRRTILLRLNETGPSRLKLFVGMTNTSKAGSHFGFNPTTRSAKAPMAT
jgi:hypothetical protein